MMKRAEGNVETIRIHSLQEKRGAIAHIKKKKKIKPGKKEEDQGKETWARMVGFKEEMGLKASLHVRGEHSIVQGLYNQRCGIRNKRYVPRTEKSL